MLGKTNITALREGAVITEIEDYRWIREQSGVHGNFVKALYEAGRLAAVTADGKVVHTADGEVWEVSEPGFAGCRLNDIEWDGTRFLLAGSHTDGESARRGLLLVTEDFTAYEKKELSDGAGEYLAVLAKNGAYILVTDAPGAVYTDLVRVTKKSAIIDSYSQKIDTLVGKNAGGLLVYLHKRTTTTSTSHSLYKVDEKSCREIKAYSPADLTMVSLFDCKGALYAMGLVAETNYGLEKITDADEVMVMCTGQNFGFVDGVYFGECQIFINSHEMLVVKKGESLADKTLDDLKEVAPEMTLRCVEKAFGQLYLFGDQGVILKSSVETDNGDAMLVQGLSAKRALAEAKGYADGKYAELETRIAELERKLSGTTLEEVDLSGYVKKQDIVPLTDEQIIETIDRVTGGGEETEDGNV